ncbi:MAG: hypothetical protein R2941_01395 [Desulfobacterales bacterium]
MIKLLIIAGIAYFGYKKLKSIALREGTMSRKVEGKPDSGADDVMIQDPFCKTWFSRKDAVHLHFEGEDYYFCSTQCRDSFLASRKS